MSSRNFECKSLQWDKDYFGISSARVNLSGIVDEKGQEEIIEFCKNYEFVTISNLNNIKENNYWIGNRTNAFLVDMNIQFSKLAENKEDLQTKNTHVTCNLNRNEQIIDIASKSFIHSRFFNDPKLPVLQGRNIYIHWTECAFGQKDKYFVISEREGKVAGYILFSINEEISVIELIAVAKKQQGKKVGKSMIHALESFVVNKGVKKIYVGTQVNNISAARFYYAMGFEYVSCVSIYHLW